MTPKQIYLIVLLFSSNICLLAQNKQAFKEVTNEIELFKHDSTKTQIYYNKALKAYNNNQHELSGNYFTKAYQYNAGKNSIYLLNASIAYFKAEKYSKIITCYETLSKKTHTNLILKYLLITTNNLFKFILKKTEMKKLF